MSPSIPATRICLYTFSTSVYLQSVHQIKYISVRPTYFFYTFSHINFHLLISRIRYWIRQLVAVRQAAEWRHHCVWLASPALVGTTSQSRCRRRLPLAHQHAGGEQLASPSETTLPFTITTIFSKNGMKEREKKAKFLFILEKGKSFLIRLGMMGVSK